MVAQTTIKLINDDISEKIISVTEDMVKQNGASNVTVKHILEKLNITNRVFYNRFRNIDEVLETVYKISVENMRNNFSSEYNRNTQFYDFCLDLAAKVLVSTYEIKRQFSKYMFAHDLSSEENFKWWQFEIKNIFDEAKKKGIIKDIDTEILSYSAWCFCRGYNIDAISRNISKEDAVQQFKIGFGCFLTGIMKQNGETNE